MLIPKSIADEALAAKELAKSLCADCKPVSIQGISTGRVHLCPRHVAFDALLSAATFARNRLLQDSGDAESIDRLTAAISLAEKGEGQQ